jgi:transposase InsO family protein
MQATQHTTEVVQPQLRPCSERYGSAHEHHADNGPAVGFTRGPCAPDLAGGLVIRLRAYCSATAVRAPQTNGTIERLHRTMQHELL